MYQAVARLKDELAAKTIGLVTAKAQLVEAFGPGITLHGAEVMLVPSSEKPSEEFPEPKLVVPEEVSPDLFWLNHLKRNS